MFSTVNFQLFIFNYIFQLSVFYFQFASNAIHYLAKSMICCFETVFHLFIALYSERESFSNHNRERLNIYGSLDFSGVLSTPQEEERLRFDYWKFWTNIYSF